MKNLYLLRHAKSDWNRPASGDFDRPLARRGLKAAPRMGQEIKRLGIAPDLILCSSARRAGETYQLIADCFPGKTRIEHRDDLYMASAIELRERLRAQSDDIASVLMIGHNPGMETLAEELAGSASLAEPRAAMTLKYPTAALAVFELPIDHWKQVKPGCGKLTLFIRPRDLEA
jgi:phosphohistidine phosphatase